MSAKHRLVLILVVIALGALVLPMGASAHPMDERNAAFVRSIEGVALGPFLYLGAKHMVTGYDHLLFLVGVIFFLYRLKDVVLYVSLFTLGHSATLLLGVLGGLSVNPYVIDAIIGLSVAYKAFENMGGFERVFKIRPNTKVAVLIFGLFHGLGLATKLQEFTVNETGLVANILSFNVGVEIGQILALSAVLIGIVYWRTRPSFFRHAFLTNSVLMVSYNDSVSVEFWAGLARHWERYEPPSHACPPGVPISDEVRRLSAPTAMVAELQSQLRELHGSSRLADPATGQIIPPYVTLYRDWTEEPFGGGWHFWKIGAHSGRVMQAMRHPIPSAPLYVCGEAWSRQQGWVEGALESADDVLENVLHLPRPDWMRSDSS